MGQVENPARFSENTHEILKSLIIKKIKNFSGFALKIYELKTLKITKNFKT